MPDPGTRTGDALVAIGASPTGDAPDEQNRCAVWVYIATDGWPRANYFVEVAPGRFTWAGGVSYVGEEPNASLSADGRLALR